MRFLKERGLAALFILNDAAMIYLAFRAAYFIRFDYAPFLSIFPATKGTPPWSLYREALRAVIPLWILIFGLWGGQYRNRFQDAAEEFLSVAKNVILGSLVIFAATFLYREYEYSRLVMGMASALSILFIFISREIWKVLAAWVFNRVIPQETVMVLGEGKGIELVVKLLKKQPHTRTLSFTRKDLGDLKKRIRSEPNLREIFVSGQILSDPGVSDLVDDCEEEGVDIKILPDLLEMRMGEVTVDDSLRLPILHLKPLSLHGLRFFVKRLFDVALSIFIVSVLFVPFVLLSLLILLDSRGGIFFVQDRVGFKEKRFKCFKFRTMRRDAEKILDEKKLPSFRGGPAFKMKDDPRVTRMGRWIRKWSLDEMGQIWNVLKGEMSLIGPRPQVLAEAQGNPDWAKKRYRILPGITGLWQVSGRADLTYEDMMRLDIYYLENWSPGLDLKILLKTLPVVLGRKGAY